MQVRVLFFASLRDLTKVDSLQVELTENATISDLKNFLLRKYPDFVGIESKFAVALNQEYVVGKATLKHGDEVALIPPVSVG